MKNKNTKFFFVVCFLSVGAALGLVHSCASKVAPPIKEIQYVEVIDSAKIIELENVLQLTRDSLNVYKHDTIMSEDEFILRFKLERIRYYTNIVDKKPNQIKFYKGWIKRVLE